MYYETAAFSLLELFRLGGITMWPLTLFSIATIAIGLERIIYLGYHNLQIDQMGGKVSQMLTDGDYDGAERYLSPLTKKNMGARVLLALVNRAKGTAKEPGSFAAKQVERAAETEATTCIDSLENGFNFLVALGSIAPLTGFLGTVTGMIGAFRAIAEAVDVNVNVVAGGIYEALITTVYGLIVAIFAMIFHTVFSHIVDKFAARVEKTCSGLIAEITVRQGRDVQTPGVQVQEQQA
ncbi:MAG: MotA/TolQ/ExbB proton channel family protein [Treponema sp.]|jgi:biopolymer transport protein ExbB|nr:MotA/TolQ/ExbB proton channel family protein [Treponema sp.]